MANTIPIEELRRLSDLCATGKDPFIHKLPKVELHTHIEGTITPAFRWRLAQRNDIPLRSESRQLEFTELAQLEKAYEPSFRVLGDRNVATVTFFDLFDEGVRVLQTELDFYELAMAFFERCAAESVRYVEFFFGPHSHRHRGITPSVFMGGYSRAQKDALEKLGVDVRWIMVLNRAKPLEEAWDNYRSVALPYRESMVVGVGLAGNEIDHPPSLFEEILAQARADGFKITIHCDPDMPGTHDHIHQVLTSVAGSGADRCDHGINIADKPELIQLAQSKNICLTLCPWTYAVYHSDHPIWKSARTLFEAGVRVTFNSDDPPYMMGHYTEGNLVLAKVAGGFSDAEIVQCQRTSIEMSWAPEDVKQRLREELEAYVVKSQPK